MNKIFKLTVVCLLMLWLAGCDKQAVPEEISETSIVVNSDGTMVYHLVGDFDKAYYDLAELRTMAVGEVDEYNAAKGKTEDAAVRVDSVELLPEASDRVSIVYSFQNARSFSDFEEDTTFFFGTVREAEEHGYSLNIAMKSVKDGTELTEGQISQYGDKKIMITDSGAVVYCPSRAIYVSEGVTVREDGSVDLSATEGKAYIVLK